MKAYEYPFNCEAAPHERVWRAAKWERNGMDRSLVLWNVTALAECPYCGGVHETTVRAPARQEDIEEWP